MSTMKATWVHKWAMLEGHGRHIGAASGVSAMLVGAAGCVPRLPDGAHHRQLFLRSHLRFPTGCLGNDILCIHH